MLKETTTPITVLRQCTNCLKSFDNAEEASRCPDDGCLLFPVAPDPLLNSQLGGFTILSWIGSGSSSSVYLASHPDFQNYVAVKILEMELVPDSASIKRFERESQLTGLITDTRIPVVHQTGVLPDGRPYLIVDYVDGSTLAETLKKEGRLEPGRALEIFMDIIGALDSAHQCGVLHRDIKPSNVMIDHSGRVKILDFGLARAIGKEMSATLTRTGISLGTPAYMSPEQCLGQETDERSEMYSLGCLMYECLSGEKVFPDNNVFNCMYQHSFGKPRPISSIVDGLPERVNQAIMRCLEKEPASRFQALSELATELRGLETCRTTRLKPRTSATSMALYVIPLLLLLLAVTLNNREVDLASGKLFSTASSSSPSIFKEQSAAEKLQDQFNDIERQIVRFRHAGELQRAKSTEDSLLKYKNLFAGKYEGFSSSKPEIHEVQNGYIGSWYPGQSEMVFKEIKTITPRRIRVTHKGTPITLVLSSDVPVQWRLETLPGVIISKISLAGVCANQSSVDGFARANDIGYEPNIFNLIDPIGWDRSTNPANRSPGQIVATSVSEAYVDVTEPTVVGPQRQAWRAQHVRWLMDDFYNSTMKDERVELHNSLRKLRYDGIRSEPSYGMTYRPTVKKLCTMNPFGRVGKADATTELAVFAGVRSGRSWYLLGSDGLLKYDLNSKTHTSLAVPAPLPEMWSCSGITRDTKRNRILVICAEMPIKIADSPRLHLYCFDEATQAWSVLSTHDSFMNGLAYSASDDKLYSLLLNNSGPKLAGHTSTLVEMDAEGGSKRYVTTSDNLNRYLRHGSSHVQMALCENDIVVHGADPPSEDPFMTTVIFDRKTGKVRYAND